MNSTGNNDWRQNGPAGVAERETGDTQDPFAATYAVFEDDEKDKTDAEEQRHWPQAKTPHRRGDLLSDIDRRRGRFVDDVRRRRQTKVNLRVRDNAQRTEQAARDPRDVTAQAIAEVRRVTALRRLPRAPLRR